jgi:hypothetical protein
MKDLEIKLEERFRQFQTVEDSVVLTDLMQRGTTALAEGTNLSLGMINKYVKFSNMQKTPLTSTIQPEKIRSFISQMFDPPLDSDIPNAHQLLSFMEQNQYEGEAIDGLWLPVKFAAPLSPLVIEEAIDYLESYEPLVSPLLEEEGETEYSTEKISEEELESIMGESNWLLTKNMIDTTAIEAFLEKHEEAPLEQVIIEATTDQWSDAINALTAVSALVSNKKVTVTANKESKEQKLFEKKWEWMKDGDGSDIIKGRNTLQRDRKPE